VERETRRGRKKGLPEDQQGKTLGKTAQAIALRNIPFGRGKGGAGKDKEVAWWGKAPGKLRKKGKHGTSSTKTC